MTWGGKREGAGRKVGWRKAEPNQRARRQLCAFDDEWEVIKEFMYLVREIGSARAKNLIQVERSLGEKVESN